MKTDKTTSPDSSLAGIRAIIPMLIGTAPSGIIFGAFSINAGLGLGGGQGLSLFVFAGSSQFVGASLYGQSVSLVIVALTTLFINLRHFLYGASLGPRLINATIQQRIIMAFFLTDETFAIASQFKKVTPRYYWGAAIAMYINWQIWTFVGLVSGTYFEGITTLNLGFVMVPAFIAIIVPQVCDRGTILCAVSATGISVFLADLPNQLGLISAAVCAIILTLFYERAILNKNFDTDKL